MFTVSRLVKSSLLVLLAATLTTAAYAREGGGGGGGGGGHNGSNGPSGPSVQVHGSPVQSDARIVSGNGSPPLSKEPVAHPGFIHRTIVRDHRNTYWPDQPVSNSYNNNCSSGCVGEGGLASGALTGGQPSYKPRDGQVNDHRTGSGPVVNDHRTGSGPVVHDHRSSGPTVTVKFP
jgi:hypothetical protein